ncbi:hypothetical protein JTB14_033773 [Gonioctena quinquepunctata]|nr:hypothetical protein JTB14_033773 [Gonioctena quinquepunctata]
MLNDDETMAGQVEDIFITPPDVNVDTDEDSGDEDGGGMIYNMTGRQLRAEAEIKLRNDTRIGGDTDDDVLHQGLVLDQDPEGDSENTISLNNWIHEYFHDDNIKTKEPPVWMKGDIVAGPHQFPEGDFTKYANFSCCGMFELFFDNELINYLIEESQRCYAQFINQQDPKISQEVLCCFLGIMFLSGYNEVLSKRVYWDIKDDVRNQMFINQQDPKISQEVLRCFLGIMFLSGYNEVLSKRMYWDIKDDVKNQMVSNAMRRNRFLQIQRFLHCADNSKEIGGDTAWKIRPVMDHLKKKFLENFVACKDLSYDESMIEYFGYGAIGTIRENRVPNSCTLMNKKHFSKQARGHVEYVLEKNSGVLLVRRMDNAVVTMESTSDGAHPIGTVKRRLATRRVHIHEDRDILSNTIKKKIRDRKKVGQEKAVQIRTERDREGVKKADEEARKYYQHTTIENIPYTKKELKHIGHKKQKKAGKIFGTQRTEGGQCTKR